MTLPADPRSLTPTERWIADFVEPAKVAALEDLDDGYRALGIATSWLRGKMTVPTF